MRKLTFIGHDTVEFTEGGKRYVVDLDHDAHQEPLAWKKEVAMIRAASLSKLKRIGSEIYSKPTGIVDIRSILGKR